MDKEAVTALAHLLATMKEVVQKLDTAVKHKDSEQVALAKKEILHLHMQINELV